MASSPIITRFAPSPTGFLHIGGARTALFNYLFAKHHGGKFLLRVEDTDRARSTPEATQAILDGMKWLGLDWDGEPIFQFARAARHAEVAHDLVKQGKAYPCYCTQAELDEFREKNPNAKFRSPWRNGGLPPAGTNSATIRLLVPTEGATTVNDAVQGIVTVQNSELDDMVLLRSDGTPTYMQAVVVDDHDMGVTNIIRGDDHFTNTFRQLQIYNAMGWTAPSFAHIPLIHGADGAKLSKRHGALGVDAYREMGFLPEALCNYLLRLGWGHGDDEIISREQAIEWFGLDHVGKSPSRFDTEKLKSVNAHYMRHAEPERLVKLLGMDVPVKAIPWLAERASTIPELAEQAAFLVAHRPLQKTEKALATIAEAKSWLADYKTALEAIVDWNETTTKAANDAFMTTKALKPKQFMPAVRAIVSGKEASAGHLPQIMDALGKQETLGRLQDCI